MGLSCECRKGGPHGRLSSEVRRADASSPMEVKRTVVQQILEDEKLSRRSRSNWTSNSASCGSGNGRLKPARILAAQERASVLIEGVESARRTILTLLR